MHQFKISGKVMDLFGSSIRVKEILHCEHANRRLRNQLMNLETIDNALGASYSTVIVTFSEA